MSRVFRHVLVIAFAISIAAPAVAHHSASMFDDTKVVEKKAVVKELQWTNPHVWLQVIVDENGKKTEWSLEGGSPNTLSRQGWRATSFKAGDEVASHISNPLAGVDVDKAEDHALVEAILERRA